MDFWMIFFAIIVGYFSGSIPFGLIFTHLFEKKDIRAIGSGNIGATNVLRTGNKMLALLTLACDALKGALPVLFLKFIFIEEQGLMAFAGVASVLGHVYPLWLKFQGGKGVATGLGAITALSWPVAFMTIALWIVVALLFRYSSLGAIIAFLCCPLFGFYYTTNLTLMALLFISILIIFKHRTNIIRLLTGTEPKIGEKHHQKSDS